MTTDFTQPSLEVCVSKLQNFSNQIHECLVLSEWERLSETLDARQLFLENLMNASTAFSDQQKSTVKQLIKTIVDQDAECVSWIENQKKQSSDQQLALGRGLKALQHYQNS